MLAWCQESGSGMWWLMGVAWIAVIATAVWAVARIFPTRSVKDGRRLLDERLARGEISVETHRSALDALGLATADRTAPQSDR